MQRWFQQLVSGVVFLSAASASASASASGQTAPAIELDPPIECWFHSEFPTLSALLMPPGEIVRSRLYFRCSSYPDYYFVDLTSDADGMRFNAVAPQAEPSCPSVHYYVEALGRDFTSSRTEERIAEVTGTDECRRRFPSVAWFPGDEPRILLGSTVAGPAFAPGFSETGIAGFISAAGVSSTVASGGGLSTGAVAGVAAGGAAAGLGVLAANAGGSTTTSAPVSGGPPPPPPPSPPSTTTVPVVPGPPAQPVTACFTLDPSDGKVETNEPLTIDGRCSEGDNLQFHYDLGDGRIKEGQAFVTAIWSQPGLYTLTLTVTQPDALRSLVEDSFSRVVTVEEPPPPPEPPGERVVAAFSTRNLEPDLCFVEFDGSSSTGDIVAYRWELDTINAFGQGVVQAEGRRVTHDWGTDCYRAQGTSFAKLTVTGRDGNTDTVEKMFDAFASFRFDGSRHDTRSPTGDVATSLGVEVLDGEDASFFIRLPDGKGQSVRSGTTRVGLLAPARGGRSVLELVLVRSSGGPVHVRLDFSATRGFMPGSLRVSVGESLQQDDRSLVLRFEGGGGERARVELRLEPEP